MKWRREGLNLESPWMSHESIKTRSKTRSDTRKKRKKNCGGIKGRPQNVSKMVNFCYFCVLIQEMGGEHSADQGTNIPMPLSRAATVTKRQMVQCMELIDFQ